jgi:hypothetical protein
LGAPKQSGDSAEAAAKPGAANAVSDPVGLSLKCGRNGVVAGTILYSDKHQEEFYAANGILMQQATNSKRVVTMPVKTSEADLFSLRVASYPGVAWVSKRNYVGREKKDGVECLHFADSYLDLKMEAWIRDEDRQPVEVHAGDWIYRFSPVDTYDGDISLSQKFQAAATEQQTKRAALDILRKINERQRATH